MNAQGLKRVGTAGRKVVFAFALAFTFLVVTGAGTFASERNLREYSDSPLYSETQDDRITIALVGVADYEVTEIFNDIVNQTPGVLESKRVRLHIDPSRPKACYATWSVRLDNLSLFELESEIFTRLKNIANRDPQAPAVTYSFTPTDKNLETLGFIRPWESTGKEIAFLLDRPLPRQLKRVNDGFAHHGYRPFRYHSQTWGHRGFE